MLADTLQEAALTDEPTQNRIIQALAQDPELTIDEAIKAAYALYSKGPWPLAMLAVRLIAAMGYPRNKPAIERFIEDISYDRNFPYYKLCIATLNEIGVEIVTPYLIRAMLDTRIDHDPKHIRQGRNYGKLERFRDVEGIMHVIASNAAFESLCNPTLAYLLAQVIADPELAEERSYYLYHFQKLGAECASYALPALIGMVQKWGVQDEDGKEAMELIHSFPKETLEPYKYLLASKVL